jgi:hypothetical protein
MSVLRPHITAQIAAFFRCRFRLRRLRLLNRLHRAIDVFCLLSSRQIRRAQDPCIFFGHVEFVARFVIGPCGDGANAWHDFESKKCGRPTGDKPAAEFLTLGPTPHISHSESTRPRSSGGVPT